MSGARQPDIDTTPPRQVPRADVRGRLTPVGFCTEGPAMIKAAVHEVYGIAVLGAGNGLIRQSRPRNPDLVAAGPP